MVFLFKRSLYLFFCFFSLAAHGYQPARYMQALAGLAGVTGVVLIYRTISGVHFPEKPRHLVTLWPSECISQGDERAAQRIRNVVAKLRKNEPLEACTAIQVGTCNAHEKAPKRLMLSTGIEHDVVSSARHVFVYSNGNRRSEISGLEGAGVLSSYVRYKRALIPCAPCLTFDYPDDKFRYFNLGRTDELYYLCRAACQASPAAHLVLMGECGGATRIFKYVADHSENASITALVGYSVMPSFDACIQGVYDSFIRSWYGNFFIPKKIVTWTASWLFPSYNQADDTLLQCAHRIQHKKIFITYHRRDVIIPGTYMCQLIEQLQQDNDLYFLIVDGTEYIPHGRVETYHESICQALHAFYKRYGIAHDDELARQGESLLEQAAVWGQNPSYALQSGESIYLGSCGKP